MTTTYNRTTKTILQQSLSLSFRSGEAEFTTTTRQRLGHGFHFQAQAIGRNKGVLIVPLLVFFALAISGFVVVFTVMNSAEQTLQGQALGMAEDTAQAVRTSLDMAILPLLSLTQFAVELQDFARLPYEIGPAGQLGSLPFDKNRSYFRVVKGGVCSGHRQAQFQQLARTITENANMQDILVSLQLVPEGVVCLAHPLKTQQELLSKSGKDHDLLFNVNQEIGHDLLSDPATRATAIATLTQNVTDEVSLTGPLPLKQCTTKQSSCKEVAVEQAFIARLPIASKPPKTNSQQQQHMITIDGVDYPRWGYAMAIIDWQALVERGQFVEAFRERGMEFSLQSSDGTVLTETPGFFEDAFHLVTTTIESVTETGETWYIIVVYTESSSFVWWDWATFLVILIACGIASLVYMVMIQKQFHQELKADQSLVLIEAAHASARRERELNDYISHEVRNPLSAAISACHFVSTAVNTNKDDETKPLMEDAETQTQVREDVAIIDASLHFVNDLLRSMLDIHRAANKQLELHVSTVSVVQDLFEPVAAMLYRRDEDYQVLTECLPADLCVTVDRLRLQQILLNLSRNSAKFVQRGFVRFRAQLSENGTVLLFVEDSGPGIPAHKQKNLFQRYQESLDSLSQGTGVGLSLCKNLVDMMGGEIYCDPSFDSGLGSDCPGTRITIDLKMKPAAALSTEFEHDFFKTSGKYNDDEPSNHAQSNHTRTASLSGISTQSMTRSSHVDFAEDGMSSHALEHVLALAETPSLPEDLSILFVDDDRILRRLGQRSMAKLMPDWTVREASSGEGAIQLIESAGVDAFDLIFVDQYMASASAALRGTETVRALRSMGVQKAILCGLSANDLETAFLNAGADAFFLKPFPCKPVELKAELQRLLSLPRRTLLSRAVGRLQGSGGGSWDKATDDCVKLMSDTTTTADAGGVTTTEGRDGTALGSLVENQAVQQEGWTTVFEV